MNSSRSCGETEGVAIGPTIATLPPLPPKPNPTTASSIEEPEPFASPLTAPTPTARTNTNAAPASTTPVPTLLPDPQLSFPRIASTWDDDTVSNRCSACQLPFDAIFRRRHHCRLCGMLFCQDCSSTRSLIPPSALVLKADIRRSGGGVGTSFSPSGDGDTSVTYVGSAGASESDDTILYGRGLERRILLARHPQRTCHPCREQLAPLQEELCLRNSNAMRYNYIDEGNELRRLCNSPLAFTLGHEVRKAAYALGNLLPGDRGRRMGGFAPASSSEYSYPPPEADPCRVPSGTGCKAVDPTLRNMDGMHIPARLLRYARGVAIVTSAKGGLGFAGFEFGTGLVVARRRPENGDDSGADPDDWSAPSAIGIGGIAWGALLGAQVSDHVFLLMTDDAVRLFASERGKSIQLGADIGVAVGPLGRSVEADIGAASGISRSLDGAHSHRARIAMSPVYTYSLSKGLYAGVSLDGRVLMRRDRVNEKFYGRTVSAHELLSGQVATPPAAQPLYDALKMCRIYGGEEACVDEEGGGLFLAGANDYVSNREQARGSGNLMERWHRATGVGMSVSSGSTHYSSPNPYNLSGREGCGPGY